MRRLTAALLFVVSYASCASAQSLPVPSHWKDGSGSELLLYTIDAKGAFTGAFISHAPGFACANLPFDLHGQVHGDHVRFVVMWKNVTKDCKSQTSWYGRVTGGAMTTWWVQTDVGHKGATKAMRGADHFQKQQL